MRIVLLGAPGSGKGTQGQRLAKKYGVPQVSSGDLLRDAVARRTELGLRAKAAMDAGELVSDEIVLAMIRERLRRADAKRGFILDGFPRNISQAEALSEMLAQIGQPISAVIFMDVDATALMRRLTGRRSCKRCGRLFNVYTSPPDATTPCTDGSQNHDLVQRPDDNEDTIRNRLEVYTAQTRPLIDHYRACELLRAVSAEGEIPEIFARLEHAISDVELRPTKPAGQSRPATARRARPSVRRVTRPAKKTRSAAKRTATSRKKRKSAPRKSRRRVTRRATARSSARRSPRARR